MARVCEVCGKGPMFGHSIQHKHSGQWRYRAPKTGRQWSPNLQTVRAYVNGGKTVRRIRVCTRCLKVGKVLRAVG
jgi:large subunit ribosomal protein L28